LEDLKVVYISEDLRVGRRIILEWGLKKILGDCGVD